MVSINELRNTGCSDMWGFSGENELFGTFISEMFIPSRFSVRYLLGF